MTEPKFAVIVEGGELTDAARDDLKNKLQELADESNDRSAIILESSQMSKYANDKASIDVVPLS
jgi:predicted transcriptional regulator